MVTIRCPDCKHKWNSKSTLGCVWCASCGKRIKIKRKEEKNGKN